MNAEPLPTRLNVRDVRADALHRAILAARERVATVDDIPRISALFSWSSAQVQVAICDLVDDGRLEEGPDGRLIVRRKAPA